MLFPLIAFSTIFILFTLEVLFPPKPRPKNPEQELGEAVEKYLNKKLKKDAFK
ncbi:hypothetical protein [Geitlerinema calcuttense]|uniref:Uncharacterized protein n=1 Tax=Geitlerinema calcuttense NRMC-F 0142 TaxID=2922238 RepID=A0ABT7LVP3_9CYAN|nr:hypothetical protein [Geitlerinema calcuttense]MDL5056097.1 hypothetical protein [Geitlerinema calcuttense NRMC-F 0142]